METKIISKDIRSLAPKRLKHFTVPQGACTDGEYIYIAFEQKKKKGRPHRIKIVKLDAKTMKVVKVSGALKLGHANDLCVRNGIIYATHSAGSIIIHRVTAKSLKQKKGFKVIVPKKYSKKGIEAFNGIATYGKGFILRVMHGRGMAIIKKKRGKDGKMHYYIVKFYRTDTMHKTSQGMTTDGMTIVRAYSHGQSGKNYIVEYSAKGKEKSRHKIILDGEMECVFILDGERYATTYIKYGKKRKAYIAKII